MAEHNPYFLSAAGSEEALLQIILARRARARIFGPNLFSDPGWDVLLSLFLAGLRRQRRTLEDLGKDIALSPNLIGRWINTLNQHGLVRLRPDLSDGRRILIELSEKGADAMRQWLQASREIETGSGDRVFDLLSRIKGDGD